MSKFLKLFIVYVLIVTSILSILGYVVDKGLQKSGFLNFAEWNDIRQGAIKADLIISGSSRAWVHVSPFILDTALHLNSYNLGFDGQNIEMQNLRLKFYEKYNGRPRTIIHCVDIYTLTRQDTLFYKEQFAPYLNDPIIREGTARLHGFTLLDYFNPFTKYQYETRYIAMGVLEYFNIRHWKSTRYKGYEGQDLPWDNRLELARKKYPIGWTLKPDDKSIAVFDAYLKDCKENDVQVILVYPPEYIEGQSLTRNRGEIIGLYSQLARKYNIPFLNYSDDTLSTVKSYFYNTQHLNKNGSELFTALLAEDLKRILK